MTILPFIRRLGLAIALLALGASIASAQFPDQRTYAATSGGSLNAQTILVPNYTLKVGIPLRFIAGFTNTATATLTVSNQAGSLGAITLKKLTPSGLQSLSGREIQAGETVTVIYDGTNFQLLAPNFSAVPTFTHLTTGAGTYTPPTGTSYIKFRLLGAGAGGAGSGTFGGAEANGTDGTATSLGSVVANPGLHGVIPTAGQLSGVGGLGGSAGSGTAYDRHPGGSGAYGMSSNGGTWGATLGAVGGISCLGGPGMPNGNRNARANTGSGGSGGESASTQTTIGGAGAGGAGECVNAIITAPGALAYVVGAKGLGGAPGANGFVGGDGADGDILIEEHYD